MQSAVSKKDSIKKILKYVFGGLSLIYIGILFFMVLHDVMTGVSSTTAEYCAKYGILVSPGCW
jgi:putative flippase GtrA